ncbi:hypothetical protein DAPPUDRAFT_334979 [Daphnia pulex]|uniref:Uncharacterized protein n=1 Tax=Daphnia pulex TaxID=6669 RepID=E9HWT6_DAPPU|nr:hypothetical protein DAPPUDRAFT_334979 [Daphnia pulex]|eukprot:EFX63795.1 hypothetical protein DAPPUDRAFT_334979 [Daphnia pulex]
MPNSAGHVKFVMPPIGSIGSGLASYRDLTRTLTDENGTLYSALSAIVYMESENFPIGILSPNDYPYVTFFNELQLGLGLHYSFVCPLP